MILLGVVGGLVGLAAVVPLLVRVLDRDAGWVVAAALAGAAGVLALRGPAVLEGQPVTATVAWVPAIDLALSLRMDALGLLFALVVLGIGATVMAYSARYFSPGQAQTGRTLALLTFFAAAMLGLVLADDGLVLFVFWELTSVSSFFLIGGLGEGRAGATRALLTTSTGGLALLAGMLLLGLDAGTLSLSTILADSSLAQGPLAPAVVVLLLLAAATKSAQVPFHFWLPGAMVAPTPVSTYLHAATMVKAGIYLMLRMAPLYGEVTLWRGSLIAIGLASALLGAAVALVKTDLKALLAYGTVSQLGLLTALIGIGSPLALAAATLHIVAHALFKATLFMSVGIIDHQAGTRDLTELGGLRRHLAGLAAAGGLAAVSMAGLPPLLGFVSKEEALAAFVGAPGPPWLGALVTASIVVASIGTFAYSARYYWRTFEGPEPAGLRVHRAPRTFVAVPLVTAVAGAIAGFAVPLLAPLVNAVARDSTGVDPHLHLALWHGVTLPLVLSVVIVASGLGLFAAREAVERWQRRFPSPVRGDRAFDHLYDVTLHLGRRVGAPASSAVPASYLLPILATLVLLGAGALRWGELAPAGPPALSQGPDWVIIALLVCSIVGVIQARSRIGAVATLGFTGYLVAAWFVLLGAPDLALTQLLVETLTVAVVVLAFRRLPRAFTLASPGRRISGAMIAAVVGVLAGVGTYALTGRRPLSEAGAWYLSEAEGATGGANVVNTILVDFRALDTLGEITVLAVAAAGIYALLRLGRPAGSPDNPGVVEAGTSSATSSPTPAQESGQR